MGIRFRKEPGEEIDQFEVFHQICEGEKQVDQKENNQEEDYQEVALRLEFENKKETRGFPRVSFVYWFVILGRIRFRASSRNLVRLHRGRPRCANFLRLS